YSNIPVDSSTYVIEDIVKTYKENHCDGIIAVGGGSVIDSAKGAFLMISQKAKHFEDIVGFEILKKVEEIPFFVIPTTSGTGSEATAVAVISNPNKNIKMEIISEHMQPHMALIDSHMTLSLPLKTTASTAVDALTHAIEAYSCSGKNPISDIYATSAIQMIFNNINKVISNPKDKQGRLALAVASYNAGCAFSNSMVGVVHGIGHALGAVCHIPHGDAMSMLLVPCMKFNLDECKDLYGELLLYVGGSDLYASTPLDKRAIKTIECIETLQHELHNQTNLPISLLDIDNLNEFIDLIVEKAMNDGAMIVNAKNVTKQDILDILGGYYGY
ncbi:MAG: iron-containing alcohol dehydrogenase, partial [Erysipelotrichaceae bacterium]|nr:iron-containing alcohol dehydrogenase [Erysipelotrichaceae bacterium]